MLEKNVYSATFGRKILYVSIQFIWPKLSFKTSIFLQIFYLDALSIDVREIFNFPTTIVLLSISFFLLVNIYCVYLCLPM